MHLQCITQNKHLSHYNIVTQIIDEIAVVLQRFQVSQSTTKHANKPLRMPPTPRLNWHIRAFVLDTS